MKARWLAAAAGAAVVLAVAGIGIAQASIPDSSGVIHACYKIPVPAHGTNLQVIDTGAGGSCASGFAAVTWNAGPPAVQIVTATAQPPGFPTNNQATATCPSGTVVTGGGFDAGQVGGTAVGQSFKRQ